LFHPGNPPVTKWNVVPILEKVIPTMGMFVPKD
jgi:hypothetical protein